MAGEQRHRAHFPWFAGKGGMACQPTSNIAARPIEARNRDVRDEAPRFGLQPRAAASVLDRFCQLSQWRRWVERRPDRLAMPVVAMPAFKVPNTAQLQREGRAAHLRQGQMQVIRHAHIDIADKAQGEVQIVATLPAGAIHALHRIEQRIGDKFGQRQGNEQTRHSLAFLPAGHAKRKLAAREIGMAQTDGIFRRILVRLLAMLGSVALLSACTSAPQYDLVIRDVRAFDAVNGVREGVDVAISGDTIAAVGADLDAMDATIIEGGGRTLIPGLWDAHVHLAYDPAIDHEIFFPLALAHGITSLRDTGGHLDQLAAARAAAGTPSTPDLYIAGPLLDGVNRIYDGSSAAFVDLSVGLASPAAARARVDELADAGVHFVKAYEMLEPEVFAALAERARERGLPVSAHPPLTMTAGEVVAAGVSDLQHLRNLELACVADPEALLAERRAMLEAGPAAADATSYGGLRAAIHTRQRGPAIAMQDEGACAALIASFAENDVFQTPTALINRLASELWFKDPEWIETFAMLPADLRENWTTRVAAIPAREPGEAALAFAAWNRAMILRLAAAGVPIMAGTDAPIAFLTPGVGLHAELAALVDLGLTPAQALEAATLTPARWFGLEGERGTIAPGMAADLVLLDADPLADIANTRAIGAVMKDGVWHDRAALDAMVAK